MADKYTDFTLQELMAVAAAREIQDGEKVIIGTGLPLIGAFLAQKTHAPNIVAIYESGAIDCKPIFTPFSVADPVLVPGAAMQGGLVEGLGVVHAGDLDVGFLGGAQIDKYGNLNAHVIGDYRNPKVRFAGSGGSNDIGAGCKRTIVMMLHQKQRFSEKVDFITTPGYLGGGKEREKMGFPGGGPSVVVSTMAILRFHPETKEMYLASYHPGLTVEDVKANTGWDLKVAPDVKETERPAPELIRILREELDPTGIFLKKK
ncbi:MAG: Glutaconate CoA-transferase subunit B [Smithella sp. PtaU1.Bin162]|nr:MAG: Glutaconate CoA-transferase subunit B [Smithella sp. PtaU1.Bin162]